MLFRSPDDLNRDHVDASKLFDTKWAAECRRHDLVKAVMHNDVDALAKSADSDVAAARAEVDALKSKSGLLSPNAQALVDHANALRDVLRWHNDWTEGHSRLRERSERHHARFAQG